MKIQKLNSKMGDTLSDIKINESKSDSSSCKHYFDTEKKDKNTQNKYRSASVSDVYTKEVKSDDGVILNKSNKKKYDFCDKSLNRTHSFNSFNVNKNKKPLESIMSNYSHGK